jgi:hypothetical protein
MQLSWVYFFISVALKANTADGFQYQNKNGFGEKTKDK